MKKNDKIQLLLTINNINIYYSNKRQYNPRNLSDNYILFVNTGKIPQNPYLEQIGFEANFLSTTFEGGEKIILKGVLETGDRELIIYVQDLFNIVHKQFENGDCTEKNLMLHTYPNGSCYFQTFFSKHGWATFTLPNEYKNEYCEIHGYYYYEH